MPHISVKKVILGIAAVISSYMVGGTILDGISNAIAQISWSVTIVGTFVLGLLWVGLRLFLKKHPIQWKNYKVTRLGYYPACGFLGFVLLLWTPPILNQFSFSSKPNPVIENLSSQEKKKEAKVVILVSEFEGKDPQGFGVTQIIFEQISNAIKDYKEVKVKRIQQIINTTEAAQTIGKEEKADIVLWGAYLVNQAQARVTVHFEIIDGAFDIPLQKDTQIINDEATKLESFTIQEQLSREMSYLVLFTVGLVRLEIYDFDGAIEIFTKTLSLLAVPEQIIEPNEIYEIRGFLFLMKGMFDKALSDLSTALGYKREANTLFLRSYVYKSLGNLENALKDIDESIVIKSTDEAYDFRCSLHFILGNSSAAIVDCNKAIEMNPQNLSALLNRSEIYRNQGDLNLALSDISKVIDMTQDDFINKNILSHIDPDTLSFYYSSALDMRGRIYKAKGTFEQALADYSLAIEINPYRPMPYYNRGQLYLNQKQLDEAINDLNIAIELNFNGAYSLRGDAYFEKGELDKALEDYNNALKFDSNNSYEHYNSRGSVYIKKNEFDRAINDFNESIKLKPNYAPAYGNRCYTYLGKGLFTKALADCNKAINLSPGKPVLYNNRATVLFAKKEFARSVLDLNKALELDSNNIQSYVIRGVVYLEQGEKNNAISDFKKVIELGNSPYYVKVAKDNLCELGEGEC